MRKLNQNLFTTILISFIISALVGFLAGTLAYNYLISLSGQEISQIIKSQKEAEEQVSSKVLSQEEQVIQVVKQAAPAVVSIIISKDLPVLEQYYEEYDPFGDFFGRDFFDDFFNPFKFRIPQYRQKGTEKQEVGGGTGFIVSADGLILTNKHVVEDTEASYTVLTNEGEKLEAAVLARDPVQDIAILQVAKHNLPTLQLGDSDQIQIGQTVIAIGNALGEFRNTVSLGVISGLKRSVTATSGLGQTEQLAEVIQTDAAINRGNSGGPLLNLRGQVIGINVAMALGAENIGFALPINLAKRDLEQVRREGKITYPFLGVRYILINQEIQKKNNLPVDYGALIIRGEKPTDLAVVPGSPADQAGLVENDIILEMDGIKIDVKNNLAKLVQQHQIGDLINLKVLHKGEEKMVRVKLGERE